MRPRLFQYKYSLLTASVLLGLLRASAQTPAPPAAVPPPSTAPAGSALPPPQGQVLIQSSGVPPASPDPAPDAGAAQAQVPSPVVGEGAQADVTDAERSAVLITAYDLDLRLAPIRGGLNMRAMLTVRNAGSAPLKGIPLQISSSLRWESATLVTGRGRVRLPLAQHALDTDADHTGGESEAILSLPQPLLPGESAALDVFYSGAVPPNAGRLAQLGANAAQQANADWDAVSPHWTALRGFGNVLWYPVASPQLFLAEGNTLFGAVGRMRLAEAAATVQLRLSVEYLGEPPVAAYFCGRRKPLKAVPDDPDAPTSTAAGLANADFSSEPLGFRTPSLFLIDRPEVLLGGGEEADPSAPDPSQSALSSSSTVPVDGAGEGGKELRTRPAPVLTAPSVAVAAGMPFLAVESADSGAVEGLSSAANTVVSLLQAWLGPQPLSALTLIDHGGQPFEDGPLLVAPAAVLEASPEQRALLGSLTHAWVQTGQPWMDEGLAQFFGLLWTEREHGRDAAVASMTEFMKPVALSEPDPASADKQTDPQPLVSATEDVMYRNKAGAVWWMLRDLVGEAPLRAALSAWRTQPASNEPAAMQAEGFERLLERLSGKDLRWLFTDWVLHDYGLPDLTLADVQTSQTPAAAGHSAAWLVAVTVRNDGGAVADVPLIVRSGTFSTTQRMRVPSSSTVTQRVLVETAPTEVVLNDGGVPEVRTAVHTRALTTRSQ